MGVYFFTLFTASFFASIAEKYKANKKLKNLLIFLIFCVLVFVQGARDFSVGTDTAGYVRRFIYNKFTVSSILEENTNIEIGYKLLEYIAQFFSTEYYSLLIAIAIFVVFFQLKSIYKLSVLPQISIFIFITFCIYTFSFNGIRQGIATAIYTFAIYYLIRGSFLKYCLIVLLAYLFHKSVIVTLPLYFVFRKKFSYKWLMSLTIITGLIVVFFDRVLNIGVLISDKYTVYTELNATGGYMLTLFYFLQCTFFILSRKVIKKEFLKYYDIYLNMFITGTIVFLIVIFTGAFIELTRLGFYFLISTLFIWPLIIKSYGKANKLVLYIGFYMSHFIYFYIFLSKMANLTPYEFNSQIF